MTRWKRELGWVFAAACTLSVSAQDAAPPMPDAPPSTDSSTASESAPAPGARAALLRDAEQLLRAQRYAEAEPLLAQARAMQDDATVAYNLGLCAYELGRFDEAAERFREASLAADAGLSSAATFNEGNARYRDAVRGLESADDEASPSDGSGAAGPDLAKSIEALEQAIGRMQEAATRFRDSVRSNPGDRDARANAELAHRTLREWRQALEELKRQQEEQQQQQQDQPQDQQQQNQQDQPQDQQQQNQQGQPQDQQQQNQQGQPPPSVDAMEQLADSKTGESAVPEGDLAANQSQPPAGQSGQAGAVAPSSRLSKEQAERLLQLIRDKEQQRRAALALERLRQRQRTPVRQDW